MSTTRSTAIPAPLRQGESRLMTFYRKPALPLRIVRRATALLHTLWLRAHGAHLGAAVSFGRDPQLYGLAGLIVGDRVNLGRRARLETHRTERGQGQLSIGSGTNIGNDFHAGAALRVLIGRNCMIASGVTILDHDHDFADPFDARTAADGVVAAPTVVEDSVFLGEHVVVLKGVRIGNGSVIGANSVVSQDIPPLTMAAGAPARPIRRFNESTRAWDRIAPASVIRPGPRESAG